MYGQVLPIPCMLPFVLVCGQILPIPCITFYRLLSSVDGFFQVCTSHNSWNLDQGTRLFFFWEREIWCHLLELWHEIVRWTVVRFCFRCSLRRVERVYKLVALEFHVLVEKGRPFLSTSSLTNFTLFTPDSLARGASDCCGTVRCVLVFPCSSMDMCNWTFYAACFIWSSSHFAWIFTKQLEMDKERLHALPNFGVDI